MATRSVGSRLCWCGPMISQAITSTRESRRGASNGPLRKALVGRVLELGDHRLRVELAAAGAFVPASGRLPCLPLRVTTHDERSFLRAGTLTPCVAVVS